jgi:hypothetical protein
MTAETQPAEERWALILRKPYPDGTYSSITFYHYPTEAAAQADKAKWAQHPAYREYTEQQVLPEALVKPLLGEREVGR